MLHGQEQAPLCAKCALSTRETIFEVGDVGMGLGRGQGQGCQKVIMCQELPSRACQLK